MCLSEAEHTWTLLCEVMSNIWDCFFFFGETLLGNFKKDFNIPKGGPGLLVSGRKMEMTTKLNKNETKQYSKNVALNND